jgi:hypothetical protein
MPAKRPSTKETGEKSPLAKKPSKAVAGPGRLRKIDPKIDPSFAPVAAAFAKDREVGLGRMFSSSSVLNVKGKIFAMLVKGKLVVKLPREQVADLVASGEGAYFDPGHGRLMKEWVAVAGARPTWIALAREAHAFVKAGKPSAHSQRPAT